MIMEKTMKMHYETKIVNKMQDETVPVANDKLQMLNCF